ncbi:MAG: type II secretion system GspH family protein [Deferribacteraceae bacterium]|nr:type II secretion system GspH family protein [Deferribacteraceae bacterium]
MKKGFSFVELSIVLVIVGLIMAMVLKGKELITSSEIRKELNKFRKYEAAFTGSLMKTNKPYPKELPELNTVDQYTVWSDNISDTFIEQNYLKEEDKYMRYNTKTPVVFYPDLDSGGEGYPSVPVSGDNYTRRGENFSVYLDDASEVFICLLENMIDDRDTVIGRGRLISGNRQFTNAEYSDCTGVKDVRRAYAYMFFKR